MTTSSCRVLWGCLFGLALLMAGPVYAECPQGMVSLWSFDETDGDVFADTISGNNGTGAPSPAPVLGKVDGAQAFDGGDTAVNVSAAAAFNWADNDSFSIEFWMKRESLPIGDNEVIAGRDDTGQSQMHWWVGLWQDGKAAFVLRGSNGKGTGTREDGEYLEGKQDLSDGIWHHVAVVRDAVAPENRLYVDGVLNDSFVIAYDAGEGFVSAIADLNIGWLDLSSGFHYTGALDELAIYNRVLTAAEIAQHFNDGGSYCTESSPPPDDGDGGGGGGGGGCFIDTTSQ